jgi:hypothetical protein
MPKQYLEIDSSYRNRNLHPNPASFNILTNLYNTESTRLNAVDPVCDSSSIVSWQANNFEITTSSSAKKGLKLISVTKNISSTDYATSGAYFLTLTSLISTDATGNGVLQPSKNYYYGATVQVDSPSQSSRILSYEYLGFNNCIIKTKTPLVVTSTSVVTIVEPSIAGEIFVPNGPHSSSFINFFLYSKTTNKFLTIFSHDFDRSTIQVRVTDTSFSSTEYDLLEIRKTEPKIFNEQMDYLTSTTITASINNLSFPFKAGVNISNLQVGDFLEKSNTTLTGAATYLSSNQVTLDSVGSTEPDSYIGGVLRLIMNKTTSPAKYASEDRIITAYTSGRVVTVSLDFINDPNSFTTLSYIIFLPTEARRITNIVNETFTVNAISGNTISIINNTNASIESGFYKDFYIEESGFYGYITDHTVVKTSIVLTNTLTVNTEFASTLAFNDTIQIHSCKLKTPFSSALFTKITPTIDSFSVLGFSRDNRVFMRGGTDHSRTVVDEFDITLTNLILPNRPLKCSKGGYITEYPYVYVRFTNPAIYKPNYFLSNSKHTEGINFRVPITNFVDDQTTDFVLLVSGDMTYTTMFTFSEDLEFQVTLPDGSIFETIDSDSFSPSSPNSNLQISAFFELRKTNIPM